MKCNNILEAVGRTPLVRLNRINQGLKPQIYVKADYTNPGGSVKDRIGVYMIDEAERKGLLKAGGTIIEGTSGNTGIGLALVGVVRGYKLVFTITDKQSKEKVDLLKALGAEVIVCPTAVEPDDPRSYYSVAKKLAKDIPNSFYPNQYENPMNPEAHYQTTMDFKVVDDVVQVNDQECFVWARRLVKQEGIFTGGSGGGCVSGALRVAKTLPKGSFVVAFLPDTGMRYLSKVYSDEWMRE